MDTIGHFRIDVGEAFDSNGKKLENIFTLNRTTNDIENDSNIEWQILYQFNTESKQIDDFKEMLEWVQSSECARFYNRSFSLKHAEDSLKMLVGYTLTTWTFKKGVEIAKEEVEINKDNLIPTIEKELNVIVDNRFVPRNIQ